MEWTKERREKQAERFKKVWETKREQLIEKQKRLGYRTYGEGLFYKTNKTRCTKRLTNE